MKAGSKPRSMAGRFWAKVSGTGNICECWIWTGARNDRRGGYGTFGVSHVTKKYAHRVAYELAIGPIPAGLVIDHLCRVHDCVNPFHMEAVAHKENVRRGEGVGVVGLAALVDRQKSKTLCPAGHPYAGDNLIVSPRGNGEYRRCLECTLRRRRERALRASAVTLVRP